MKAKKHPRKIIKVLLIIVSVLLISIYLFLSISTSVTNNLDKYEYALPFMSGTKHKVVQGYGGLFSHNHIAAIDFEMPEGTPIYAAREGNIYSYKDCYDEGGPFSKYKNQANYIIIKHSDGSFGCYWHLKKNGVVIKHGFVSKGQQIGYSGATGFVLKPHLHFSVKVKLNYETNSFVRTKFKTSKGTMLLESGEIYEKPAD